MKLFMVIVTCFFILPTTCQNLVPNGDFKKYDETTGRPADWLFNRYNEVVEEGPDGSPALRMTSYYRSKDGAWKANAMTSIPKIAAGTCYTVNFQLRNVMYMNSYKRWSTDMDNGFFKADSVRGNGHILR